MQQSLLLTLLIVWTSSVRHFTLLHMKTIAIIAQKGGVAKTTLCINLSIAANIHGKKAAVLDMDQQGSIMDFSSVRKLRNLDWPIMRDCSVKEPENKQLRMEEYEALMLENLIQKLNNTHTTMQKHGIDYCFIDTAPKDKDVSSTVAASVADMFIIPVGPSVLDIHSIAPTVNMVQKTKKPTCFVLVRFSRRELVTVADDIKKRLTKKYPKIPIFPKIFKTLDSYGIATESGLGVMEYMPKRGAAPDMKDLYKCVIKKLKEC